MFNVVRFENDDLAVVPVTWVANGRTAWPPYKGSMKLAKAVKEGVVPGEEWASYACDVMTSSRKSVAKLSSVIHLECLIRS